GALVASVTPNGPAEAAGIQAGDIILKFDGKDVMDMQHLPRIVAETDIGKEVPVEVWRKGKRISVSAKVGELEETEQQASVQEKEKDKPAPSVKEQKVDALGVSLAPLTPELRDQYDIGAEVKGVVITAVEDSGNAADKGLRPGDVIVEVNQEEVTSPDQAADKIEQAKKQKRKS